MECGRIGKNFAVPAIFSNALRIPERCTGQVPRYISIALPSTAPLDNSSPEEIPLFLPGTNLSCCFKCPQTGVGRAVPLWLQTCLSPNGQTDLKTPQWWQLRLAVDLPRPCVRHERGFLALEVNSPVYVLVGWFNCS